MRLGYWLSAIAVLPVVWASNPHFYFTTVESGPEYVYAVSGDSFLLATLGCGPTSKIIPAVERIYRGCGALDIEVNTYNWKQL